VDSILSAAKPAPKPDAQDEGPQAFGGAGFSMRDDPEPAGAGEGVRRRRGGSARDPRAEVPPRTVTIVFYKEGFTVEDTTPEPAAAPTGSGTRIVGGVPVTNRRTGLAGLRRSNATPRLPPLRPYDDPKHDEFLKLVKSNRLPPELQETTKDTGLPIPVNIALQDRRPEPYPEPSEGGASYNAFAGSGQTLGGSTAPSGAAAPTGADGVVGGGEGERPLLGLAWVAWLWSALWRQAWGWLGYLGTFVGGAAQPTEPALPTVDPSLPVTEIRMRLADGGEVVTLRLNETAAVADLFALAESELISRRQAAQPEGAEQATTVGREWELAEGFPPRPIQREVAEGAEGDSLKARGLLGALMVQRWV